jgi:hypothetical protein
MKSLIFSIFSVILLFFLSVTICWQSPGWAQDNALELEEVNYGIIRFIKGELTILNKKDGSSRKGITNDKFEEGVELKTGENSFAIIKLPDGSTFKLDPNSTLAVKSVINEKAGQFKGKSHLIISAGGVMVKVLKKFSGPPSLG